MNAQKIAIRDNWFIGQGWIDEDHEATIIVELNMDYIRDRVKNARRFMKENPYSTMIEMMANDPYEVAPELIGPPDPDHHELILWNGTQTLNKESKRVWASPQINNGQEYEEPDGYDEGCYYLRYGRIEISPYSVYYKCTPKGDWNDSLSLSIDLTLDDPSNET